MLNSKCTETVNKWSMSEILENFTILSTNPYNSITKKKKFIGMAMHSSLSQSMS